MKTEKSENQIYKFMCAGTLINLKKNENNIHDELQKVNWVKRGDCTDSLKITDLSWFGGNH